MAIFTPELIEKLKIGYYFWPLFIVATVIYYILSYFINLWSIISTLKWVNKPPSVPVLGNALQFFGKSVTDHWKITTGWLDKYGDLVQVWIFHRPTVIVSRKEVVERLLKGTGDTLTKKSEQYSFLSDVFGRSLLTLSAVDWLTRRKLLDPHFHDDCLPRSIPTISHHARALIAHLNDKVKKSDIIDIQQYSKLTTLDVAVDALMKASPNFLEQSNRSYLEAIKTTTDILVKRSYTPMYNWNIIYLFTLTRLLQSKAAKIINDFANKVIQKRRKARSSEKKISEEKENNDSSFLDFLLDKEDKKILKEKEVVNEVKTFLFAAHDTVAAGIAFTLYLIGCHPQIQEKIFNEIKSELPELSSEKDPSADKLNKLDLLGRCIKESLRLYPPVPWIGRVLKNYIKIDGENRFPEGANVAINVYKLHRNEKYYANPNQFDPDRFLAKSEDSEDFSYIPFGAGWRNCIGQKFAFLEMKIILAHILNQYSVTSIDKPEDLELTGNFILRSTKGLKVRLNQRNK